MREAPPPSGAGVVEVLTGARTDAPRGGAYAQRQNLDWIESVVAAQRERDDARSEFAGLFTAARGLLR